jgi:Xaa-Pro aminopeptidase
VGCGSNGAIVHYRPEEGISKQLKNMNECLLIDTGAHYLSGTTDTTRTLVFDDKGVSSELKEMYTRVLMGNLDL